MYKFYPKIKLSCHPINSQWHKRILTYDLNSAVPACFTREEILKNIKRATKTVEKACAISFKHNDSDRFADIIIKFGIGSNTHKHLSYIYFPLDNGNLISGDIFFDPTEMWTFSNWNFYKIDFETIFLHQLLHVLGIEHNNKYIKGSVMNEYYNGPKRKLGKTDIKNLQIKYPNSECDY